MCDEDWPWILAFCTAGSLGAFYWLWRSVRRYRLIADTPTSRLRSAAQGLVELSGSGHFFEDRPLQAPLTKSDCIWFDYKIERKESYTDSKGNRRTRWVTVESGTSEDFFTMRDETGECHVNPAGADVVPLHDYTWYGHSRHPTKGPPPRRGFFSSGFGGYRYTERRMHGQDPLYALGWFETLRPTGLDQGVGGMLRDILGAWKRDYEYLLARFDQDGDGKIDLEEWKVVRDAARLEAEQQMSELHAAPDVNVLTRPPGNEYPFILSGRSEAETARRYKIQAALGLLGFLALGAFATYMGTECLSPALG